MHERKVNRYLDLMRILIICYPPQTRNKTTGSDLRLEAKEFKEAEDTICEEGGGLKRGCREETSAKELVYFEYMRLIRAPAVVNGHHKDAIDIVHHAFIFLFSRMRADFTAVTKVKRTLEIVGSRDLQTASPPRYHPLQQPRQVMRLMSLCILRGKLTKN